MCFNTVLFRSNGNSYTVSTQSDMCIYIHIVHHIETLIGQKEKLWRQWMSTVKEIFPRAIFGTRATGSQPNLRACLPEIYISFPEISGSSEWMFPKSSKPKFCMFFFFFEPAHRKIKNFIYPKVLGDFFFIFYYFDTKYFPRHFVFSHSKFLFSIKVGSHIEYLHITTTYILLPSWN